MKSLSGSTLRDVLRRSFGFLPAVGILAGLVLGFVLPVVDRALRIDFGIFSFTERDSARSLLETIASVTVSVAGVGFSVTIVAFTLASQQLSPRVLRTFQSDRLSQALLGAFLGTFAFCLVVLATLDAGGEALPDLSLAVAVLGAIASFALFVAFIQNAVVSLQASTLIRRMAADGQASIDRRFPAVIGADPDDPQEALRQVRERMADGDGLAVRAGRAGFLTELKGEELFEAVRPADALVEQCLPLGDFVLTGGLLARVWPASGGDGDHEDLVASVEGAFALADERTVVYDVAFPVRQLADVALRGLSPSLNDPTTAENAMNSLADILVRFAAQPVAPVVRTDVDGEPRLVATPPALDDLVRLGFEQVRVKAATYPVVCARLLVLLGEVERAAGEHDVPCGEVARQARLLREGAEGNVPTRADVEAVAGGPGAGDGQPSDASSADARSATSASATTS